MIKLKSVMIVMIWMLLTACSSIPIKQLPSADGIEQYQLQEVTAEGVWNYLLIVEVIDAQQWRWILLDGLGAPLSRQILVNNQWKNDGFIPPSLQYRLLFNAILANKVKANLPEHFTDLSYKTVGNDSVFYQHGNEKWRSRSAADGKTIYILNNNSNEWHIKQLQ